MGSRFESTNTLVSYIFSLSGYCKIQWKQSSVGTPDPFQISTASNAAEIGGVSDGTNCIQAFITIPNLSPNGDSEIANGVWTQALPCMGT